MKTKEYKYNLLLYDGEGRLILNRFQEFRVDATPDGYMDQYQASCQDSLGGGRRVSDAIREFIQDDLKYSLEVLDED